MKIAYYCQHVLGVGHFHRSLEICRSFAQEHEVTMILGGPAVSLDNLPFAVMQLPGLRMNEQFRALTPCDENATLEETKRKRREKLLCFAKGHRPDCLMLELYPLGRKAFRFELDPLLASLTVENTNCKIYCSLRDILVEKKDGREKFEQRAIDTLNHYFHGLLIHADPTVITLDQTFGKTDQIYIPIRYTGFITPKPSLDARSRIRALCKLEHDQKLIVASIGSGSVGAELLETATDTIIHMHQFGSRHVLHLFAGPYLAEHIFRGLREKQCEYLRVERFSDQFVDWLESADLSLSMAGYNTCMNTLAAGVPALMYPFNQNREQRLRIEQLGAHGCIKILEKKDLHPISLAKLMEDMFLQPRYKTSVDLDGAAQTVKIVEAQHQT